MLIIKIVIGGLLYEAKPINKPWRYSRGSHALAKPILNDHLFCYILCRSRLMSQSRVGSSHCKTMSTIFIFNITDVIHDHCGILTWVECEFCWWICAKSIKTLNQTVITSEPPVYVFSAASPPSYITARADDVLQLSIVLTAHCGKTSSVQANAVVFQTWLVQ